MESISFRLIKNEWFFLYLFRLIDLFIWRILNTWSFSQINYLTLLEMIKILFNNLGILLFFKFKFLFRLDDFILYFCIFMWSLLLFLLNKINFDWLILYIVNNLLFFGKLFIYFFSFFLLLCRNKLLQSLIEKNVSFWIIKNNLFIWYRPYLAIIAVEPPSILIILAISNHACVMSRPAPSSFMQNNPKQFKSLLNRIFNSILP